MSPPAAPRAFVLPESWRAVRLVVIHPAGWPHYGALAEAVEGLYHTLRYLGVEVEVAENETRPGVINIYFLAFFLNEAQASQLQANSIIYNFEQIGGHIDFLTPGYRAALARSRVWDYSRRNLEKLAPVIGHRRLQVVPVGYVPAQTRIPRAPVQDIDVLFYGGINERRKLVLDALRAAGIKLEAVFGVYGAQRDALIARAKLVLNLHGHPTKIMEVVRISYLLANRKAVVTELEPDTEIEVDLRDAVAGVPYDRIVAECRRLLDDDAARQALEDRGYEIFRRRDMVPMLRQVIAEAANDPIG